ncbi:MAG: hypothetical protein V1743_07010 [Nanoarchaeota archaeon]
MAVDKREVDQFRKKYAERISQELGEQEQGEGIISHEYEEFRKAYLPKRLSLYEQWCSISEKVLHFAPDKAKAQELQEAIDAAHLNVTPTGAASFALFIPLLVIIVGIFVGYIIPSLLFSTANSFFIIFAIIIGLGLIVPFQKLPYIIANTWRLKASNQMVLCIFYIVTYMRHTSNLELAIDFAADHLDAPLSLDLKKVIWNIETERFDSIKESLDDYLEGWKKYNREFIEAMHLIESSLYESSENRRLNALDKALEVILDETYEKMLQYAHELKNPITTLHMMGVVLPILGLVILPLAVNFLGNVKWYHLFALYNIFLPIIVFYYGKSILSKRPSGYGQSDLSKDPQLKRFQNIRIKIGKGELLISPAYLALIVFCLLFFIGMFPLILHSLSPGLDCVYVAEPPIDKPNFFCATEFEEDSRPVHSLMEYHQVLDPEGNPTEAKAGPFGLGSTILSLAITLAFGLSIGAYYLMRSKSLMKIREESRRLEEEFASALFQLGNRLGDGIPAEIAFAKVARVMEGTVTGDFFNLVDNNIRKNGMGLERAIFDEKRGAIVYYPSNLIESSMKVLIESSKKGPLVASQALINVSEYIKQMHRVDERLKDLMTDVVSSMQSQISFLTPAIAGIVIGITSMITTIMLALSSKLTEMGSETPAEGASYAGILSLLGGGNAIPTYWFQIIVGLYVVQIIIILSILVNGIQNGADKLNERYLIGKYLISSTITYVLIALVVVLVFNLIAGNIIGAINK